MRDSQCAHDGTCYPAHHVYAAIDEEADAKDAVEALRTAGFTDVEWFHGADAYAAIQGKSARNAFVLRLWRTMRNVGTEGELRRIQLATLRAGGSAVIAYAQTPTQVELVRTILIAHHAYAIWYLGPWLMERLPMSTPVSQLP